MSSAAITDLLKVNDALAALEAVDATRHRDAIALVYQAIADLPVPILQDFAPFTEEMLAAGQDSYAARVVSGKIAIIRHPQPRDTLLDASRLLRALERVHIEQGRFIESDRGADLEDAWRTSDGRHFVIARLTSLKGVAGKPFLRRALLHCRVLPTAIEHFAVRLHRLSPVPDAASLADERTGRTRSYGAAFFPGLGITTIEPVPGEFLVDTVSGFDARDSLAGHVKSAQLERCTAIVWPELTMPKASFRALRHIVAQNAFDTYPAFSFLVAGSWHRLVGKEMRNVAVILDGSGEPVCEVLKWAKFSYDGKYEAIVPGSEIHVLIGEDALYVIAICRDFLEENKEVPYRNLNVDVAIVPSMTSDIDDLDTMRGHAATAQTMRVRFGTRTMVVAQPVHPDAAGVGRVLRFPANPPRAQDGELVTGAWLTCVLESS